MKLNRSQISLTAVAALMCLVALPTLGTGTG